MMLRKWRKPAVVRGAGRQYWRAALIGILILSLLLPVAPAQAARLNQREIDPGAQARILLATLTPEERVGQLFLVTFKGRNTNVESQIYDLIVNHHVGGVMLSAAQDNFVGPENTVSETYNLTKSLQNVEWQGSTGLTTRQPDVAKDKSNYIPLLISMIQEGDQSPTDQILSGFTPLPNEMALGATWKPELAAQVGEVLGKELEAVGVNLLLGPSLDVLDTPHTELSEDLGTRTFGGDPFWVGEMGKAYIRGVHTGGLDRVAVIAKHFPGRGSSDRPPQEEVATVRKSLEQLKQIELAPFFAVTDASLQPGERTDGVLVSHIRYQGFQGNIRATTRPVSFDPAALNLLMDLQPFAAWRSQGGLIVSDNLGSQAVRRFYDPSGAAFDARQVARNALLAGNDLLYVDNFISSGDADAYTTLVKTLDFFVQKYREDAAFAQRVDTAVERVLTLKYRLYPVFELDKVTPAETELAMVGKSQQASFDVARQSATLISPSASEFDTVLPRPPELRERILFITDVVAARQCSQCAEQTVLPVDALQNAVIRLYGPQAGGQVFQNRLFSYSYADLDNLLKGIQPSNTAGQSQSNLENDLRSADWVVFAMLDVRAGRASSLSMRRFLSERPDLVRNKKVVTFAFSAPYYLDATDISKLTAYYGLYSKTPAFVDVAARLLFQELTPTGALPVSVPGMGYDLIKATSPDPNQIIPLFVDTDQTAPPRLVGVTPEATPVPTFKVGDSLPLRTGVILDQNRNPVPDGTLVRFVVTTDGGEAGNNQYDTETSQGVARTAFRITKPGLLEIRVASDPALTSQILRLDITGGEAAAVTQIAPTPIILTATSEPRPTETVTATPQAGPVESDNPVPGGGTWLLTLLMLSAGAAAILWMGNRLVSLRWGLRWALTAWIGGMLAYLYVALGLPGVNWLAQAGSGAVLLVAVLGMLLGWGAGWVWQMLERPQPVQRMDRKI